MKHLKVATAQFENKSGDKKYNLSIIKKLSAEAASKGVNVIVFHECSITAYAFARKLSKNEMLDLAEYLPEGPSIVELTKYAAEYNITILAGLFEKDKDDNLYKAYVCVDKTGMIAKHRKLHPFINAHIIPGNSYTIFDLHGWKCGILICYDNNIPENVRATAFQGAEIIFMPHVTMGTPSTRPGSGYFNLELWKNRLDDPMSLRREFDGPKGREWLEVWIRARAFDNGIYCVFSNPIGMEDDQLKNGCSMIVDPFGQIIAECREFDDAITIGTLSRNNLEKAPALRYNDARRLDLYESILGRPHIPNQKVAWLKDKPGKKENN